MSVARPVDVVPPVEGLTPIRTYRGVPIYREVHDIVDGVTVYREYFYYKGERYTSIPVEGVITQSPEWKIDRLLAGQVISPEDYFIETYHGVEIWWIASLAMYRAQVATGYTAVGFTLPEVREGIDGILTFLYPPEDPGGGLFAQAIAAVKAWLSPVLTPIMGAWDSFWTYTWPAWTTSFGNLQASWDEFKTKTWVDWTTAFGNLGARWDNFWTKDYPDMLRAQAEKEVAMRAYVAERDADLGRSQETNTLNIKTWFGEVLGPAILSELAKIPATALGPVFRYLMEAWTQGGAESFTRGLEEGLAGEEG